MNQNFLTAIDRQIASGALLKHPFYQAWNRGELTLEALRDYAGQYYHHVAAFPTYLSAVHAQSDDLDLRRHLLENLLDEEHGTPNHPDLWLQFAAALGVRHPGPPRLETRALIGTFRNVCGKHGVAVGTAALYAYESQIPAVSETKIAGLKRFYGIEDSEGLAYFAVHEAADREHAATERALLEQLIDEGNFEQVTAGVGRVLPALNEMLSGVCRQNKIEVPEAGACVTT